MRSRPRHGHAVLFRALYVLSQFTCAATNAPCNVSEMIVQNGGTGDCPAVLEVGSSCSLQCHTGFMTAGPVTCSNSGISAPTCLPAASFCLVQDVAGANRVVGRNIHYCQFSLLLASGQSCEHACASGYEPVGLTSCTNGTLLGGHCEPASCNASVAPSGGDIGDCPEDLASGLSCEPGCAENYTLVFNTTCELGELSMGYCASEEEMMSTSTTTVAPQTCWLGWAWQDTECKMCPRGTYKDIPDVLQCTSCPPGSVTMNEGARMSELCTCNETTYANISSLQLLSCAPCPANSKIREPGRTAQRSDCECQEGYIAVPDSETNELQLCRAPNPCNLTQWLDQVQVTGAEPHELRLGTCENVTVLEHKTQCNVMCDSTSAPQLNTDFIRTIDTRVFCDDGAIESDIREGTWCSKGAWEMPAIIFLATVTVASSIAAIFMEWRQHSFEKECVNALTPRLSPPRTSRK